MATPHNQRQPKCKHEVFAKMTTFLSFDVGLHWATLVLGALRPPLCFNKLFLSINAAGFGRTISQAGKPRAGRAVTWPVRTPTLASRIGKFCIKWRQDGALSLPVI